MKKWIVFSSLLSLLLLSSCSWKPEKEIITKAEVYVPTINIVPRPEPLTLRNADVIVITEKNLEEVILQVKKRREVKRKRRKPKKIVQRNKLTYIVIIIYVNNCYCVYINIKCNFLGFDTSKQTFTS